MKTKKWFSKVGQFLKYTIRCIVYVVHYVYVLFFRRCCFFCCCCCCWWWCGFIGRFGVGVLYISSIYWENICIHICIYVETREREREKNKSIIYTSIHLYIYVYVNTENKLHVWDTSDEAYTILENMDFRIVSFFFFGLTCISYQRERERERDLFFFI